MIWVRWPCSSAKLMRPKIVGLIMEEAPPASLDDASLGTLKEMADPALGSGVTNLMERFGHDIEQMEGIICNAYAGGRAGGI